MCSIQLSTIKISRLYSHEFFVFKQILQLFGFDSRNFCPSIEVLLVWLLVLWPEIELSNFVKKLLDRRLQSTLYTWVQFNCRPSRFYGPTVICFFVFEKILQLHVLIAEIFCPSSEILFVLVLVLWPESELSNFAKKTISYKELDYPV